jgi:hypothetical protein
MTSAIFIGNPPPQARSAWFRAIPGPNSGSRKTQTGGIFIAPAIIMYDYSFSKG